VLPNYHEMYNRLARRVFDRIITAPGGADPALVEAGRSRTP